MQYVTCAVPVAPLRSQPSHKSEMISQLFFGEWAEKIEDGENGWISVKNVFDGYEGWCQQGQMDDADANVSLRPGARNLLTRDWVSRIIYHGRQLVLPLGSVIDRGLAENVHGRLWNPEDAVFSIDALKAIAFEFMDTAYLWGGRTVFGADCSGFTQTVLRFFNVALMRDAWQQATQGEPVDALEDAKPGDLAFFNNAEGRITHVGILIGRDQIIHASSRVRIDKIDDTGIYDASTGNYSHQLKSVRNFFRK